MYTPVNCLVFKNQLHKKKEHLILYFCLNASPGLHFIELCKKYCTNNCEYIYLFPMRFKVTHSSSSKKGPGTQRVSDMIKVTNKIRM